MWVNKLSTRKYNHNLKVQSYFIWLECLGLRARELRAPKLWENCSKEAGGKSGYIQVCNKGSRQSEPQRSGIKLRNLAFCAWEDAILIPFICTSAIGPILSHSSCCLHSPSSSAKWCWNPTHTVGSVWGALIHIWRPEITDGLWYFLLINMAGDVFISQSRPGDSEAHWRLRAIALQVQVKLMIYQ